MRNDEAQQFRDLISSTFEVFGTKTSADALTIWWNALAPYSIDQVRAALSDHVRTSVYPPKPADVINAINAHDGRPGAEEAWAIALRADDEDRTVVWTEEIAHAAGVASEAMKQGDEVAGRMAFKEAYQKAVSEARAQQKPVKWQVSLGHDKQARIEPVKEAYEQGLIGQGQALACLPSDHRDEIVEPAGYLESDQTQISEEQRQANLKEIRRMLEEGVTEGEAPQVDQGQVERTRAWAAAHRNDESEQAEATAEGDQ